MGKHKPRRKAATKVKNVVSPLRGVAQIRASVCHLPPAPQLSLKRVVLKHVARPKNTSLGIAAATIPSDMTMDDFLSLHELSKHEIPSVDSPIVGESFCITESVDLPPNIESTPKCIPNSCPTSPINHDLVPDSELF